MLIKDLDDRALEPIPKSGMQKPPTIQNAVLLECYLCLYIRGASSLSRPYPAFLTANGGEMASLKVGFLQRQK